MNRMAIMQPYLFPYIGYFQMIAAVDKFVFYDDVNFIKNGWVNRNRILVNGQATYITIPLKEASPNRKIFEISFVDNRLKIGKSIQMAYKKAPFFNDVWPIIEATLQFPTENISELAIHSVNSICNFLELDTTYEVANSSYSDTTDLDRNNRIKTICKRNEVNTYINAIGGRELYDKASFREAGIALLFIKTGRCEYRQFNNDFVPYLSIIDVLMFNSKEEVKCLLNEFELI